MGCALAAREVDAHGSMAPARVTRRALCPPLPEEEEEGWAVPADEDKALALAAWGGASAATTPPRFFRFWEALEAL